jgi:hypothetical protein
LKREIEMAEQPSEISVEVQLAFDRAIEAKDDDLVRRILLYNSWCHTQSGDPAVTDAAVCGLWWHLFRYSEQDRQLAVLKFVEKWLGRQGLKDFYQKHWQGLVPAHLAKRFELEEPGFTDMWGGKA